MKGLFFLAALVAAGTVDAFVPIQTCQTSFRRISSSEVLLSTAESSPPEFADSEREEMKDLILSLSLESTDHKRRMRLKDVLHEALDRPNGMPQRFTDLFDITLAEVGDEIQREAKKKFFEAEAAEQAKAESSDDESSDDINGADEFVVESDDENEKGGELKLKTPEELQLWALVDMMVQSKTIVKKASGELGSKGTFQ